MIPSPVPIEVEYHKDVILRYWVGTENPSTWTLRWRLTDDEETVLVTKTPTTAAGTKSDGTSGYYALVDLSDGTSYALLPAVVRHHILERTDSASRRVQAHGPYTVRQLPGQPL